MFRKEQEGIGTKASIFQEIKAQFESFSHRLLNNFSLHHIV